MTSERIPSSELLDVMQQLSFDKKWQHVPHAYTAISGVDYCKLCNYVRYADVHIAHEYVKETGFAMGYNETGLAKEYDAVNNVQHYETGGPLVRGNIGEAVTMGNGAWEYMIKCIDVMRHIKDPRLATALKYIWRVAFGGKREPWDSRTDMERDTRDIKSAIWYLQDWVSNPVGSAPQAVDGYNRDATVQDSERAE